MNTQKNSYKSIENTLKLINVIYFIIIFSDLVVIRTTTLVSTHASQTSPSIRPISHSNPPIRGHKSIFTRRDCCKSQPRLVHWVNDVILTDSNFPLV